MAKAIYDLNPVIPQQRKAVPNNFAFKTAGSVLPVKTTLGPQPKFTASTPLQEPADTGPPAVLPFPETPKFTPPPAPLDLSSVEIPPPFSYDEPPPKLALPDWKDFKYFQGIKPDLQEVKQYEAVTGRQVSPAVIEGMTEAKLGAAADRAIDVGQLNLQRNVAAQNLAIAEFGADSEAWKNGLDVAQTENISALNIFNAEINKMVTGWNTEFQNWQGVVGNEEAAYRADVAEHYASGEELERWQENIEEGDLSSLDIATYKIVMEGYAPKINEILLTQGWTDAMKKNAIDKLLIEAKLLWVGSVTGGASWGDWSDAAFFKFIGIDDPRLTTLAETGQPAPEPEDEEAAGTSAIKEYLEGYPSARPEDIGEDPSGTTEAWTESTLPGTDYPGVSGLQPSVNLPALPDPSDAWEDFKRRF